MNGPASMRGLVISDGRRGIENQALGLAEAMARVRAFEFGTHRLEAGAAFKAASPKMQLVMRGDPIKYGIGRPFPEIVIGCGRQAIAPLLALKKAARSDIFTIYIQAPRIGTEGFDLVITPEHDRLSGDNIESMIGSPNRINNTELITNVLAFNDRLAGLPMPRVAMLIGGDSKTHKLTAAVHAKHLKAAQNVLASGRALLLTLSRRTPDTVRADYRALAAQNEEMWLYDGEGSNPYFAFLGASDTILVTEDSTNMLTEACTAGKSVFTLPMEGEPGKFQILYDALLKRCGVKPYDSLFSTPDYVPLAETARMADAVWKRVDKARR